MRRALPGADDPEAGRLGVRHAVFVILFLAPGGAFVDARALGSAGSLLAHRVPWIPVVSVGTSLLLGAAAWTAVTWLRGTALLAGTGPRAPTRPVRLQFIGDDTNGVVQATLVLVLVAALAWVLWHDAGPWQYALAVVATIALGTLTWPRRPPLTRWGTPSAPASGSWPKIPVAKLETIRLLVLLNAVTALVLLGSPQLFSGPWAASTVFVYLLMFGVNLAILNSCLSASTGSTLAPARDYLTPVDAATTSPGATSSPSGTTRWERMKLIRLHTFSSKAAPSTQIAATPRPSTPRPRGRLRRVAAATALLVAAAWIAAAHPGALLVFGFLALGVAIPFTTDIDREQAITMVLAAGVGVATLDYVGWRISVTNWQGWWVAAPLLCAEMLGAIHVVGYQFTIWPRPSPLIEPSKDPSRYPIFIFVPTLNEGAAILRRTLEGCLAARAKYLEQYPAAKVSVVVCNDGRAAGVPGWEDVDRLAKQLGVRNVTRQKSGGAKAGNIENARQKVGATGDALVVIFDADQVPEPEFLVETVPPFADPTIGWVQTGQYYANLKNPVARWADDQQSMFYNLLCPGKAALNAAFICGTNVVIRAAALDEIGGLPQDSVTEDFAASIALHPKWRSIYLSTVLATGLGPLDIPSYLRQQGRWARGTLGVFRSNWRDILLPKKHGLRLGQRAQYLLACTHYLCGLRDLVYMISPVLFVFTAIPAVRRATLGDYLWHFLPYIALGIAGMWYSARRVTGLRGIIIGFGSFPTLVGSLVAVILGRKTGFAVTSKKRQTGSRPVRYLWVYLAFVPLCVASLVWVTRVHGAQQTSLFISVMWIVYSLVLLSSFLGLAWADLRGHRADAASLATARQAYPSKLLDRTNPLLPVASLGLAAMMATPLLVTPRLASLPMFAPNASRFVITHDPSRYVGVSLPVQLLEKGQRTLEREVGLRFGVVGRTQDITDRFDARWAGTLAAHDARPWITVEFGVFGPDHKVPLGANLPAIINHLWDGDLRRWAAEIRDYGHPVYLTILRHADKNWSLSSAVAHGGIPEDVAKAWTHVQSIFREVGANNVAWVWAPADPVDDRPYAPPASKIDAVLQSFINYPGTTWGDPQVVLHNLSQRYPGKPLFIEASASGPLHEKAAWLDRLGRAVANLPTAYAVLYHEGGPGLTPTSAEAKTWSLASDPASLATMQRILAEVRTERRVP